MEEIAKIQLGEELEQAGKDIQISPQMLLLEEMRITPEKKLPKMDFLFRLFGMPCFPRRELVAITGKAKSGKTFVTSMLMACCQVRDVLSFHREQESPLRVLWYDTEQSDESTQDILKNRIVKMVAGKDGVIQTELFDNGDGLPRIDVFNVRAVEWKQRRKLLIEAVNMCEPDLVIIDGIRDLVNDINDGVLAQEVMEELMHLATDKECCIACVLHQNKSGEDHNLRGWIGTELMNKAFEIYSCEKLMPARVFKLEQTQTRKYDIEPIMWYRVDQQGLPVATTKPADCGSNDSQDKLPQLAQKYIVHEEDGGWHIDISKLFLDALQGEEEIGGAELRSRVMQLSGIAVPFKYNKVLQEALEQKVIEKVEHDNRTFYRPAPF